MSAYTFTATGDTILVGKTGRIRDVTPDRMPVELMAEMPRTRVRRVLLAVSDSIAAEMQTIAKAVFDSTYTVDDAKKQAVVCWTVTPPRTPMPPPGKPQLSASRAYVPEVTLSAAHKPDWKAKVFIVSTDMTRRVRLPRGEYTVHIKVTNEKHTQKYDVIKLRLAQTNGGFGGGFGGGGSGDLSDTDSNEHAELLAPLPKRACVEPEPAALPVAKVVELSGGTGGGALVATVHREPSKPVNSTFTDLIVFATEQLPQRTGETSLQEGLHWLFEQLRTQIVAYSQLCCLKQGSTHRNFPQPVVTSVVVDTINKTIKYIETHGDALMDATKRANVQAALSMAVSAMLVDSSPL